MTTKARALTLLPTKTLQTLKGHPELRTCARGLLERSAGVGSVLLDLLGDSEREVLILSVLEEHDDLSGSILQDTQIFDGASVAQELEYDTLEHLVSCGHAVTWLGSFRHILVIGGHDLGPAKQNAIRADLDLACVQGGWTVLKFQQRSLMRPRLRQPKPKEDARFAKNLETGVSLLAEDCTESLGTLVPALLLAAHRLKREKKSSKAAKRRIVNQLVAVWADTVCLERGWTRLMMRGGMDRYEPAVLSPRHRSYIRLVDVEERLLEAKSDAIPDATDGPHAQPFGYAWLYAR